VLNQHPNDDDDDRVTVQFQTIGLINLINQYGELTSSFMYNNNNNNNKFSHHS
jgi:hypothetical protein